MLYFLCNDCVLLVGVLVYTTYSLKAQLEVLANCNRPWALVVVTGESKP